MRSHHPLSGTLPAFLTACALAAGGAASATPLAPGSTGANDTTAIEIGISGTGPSFVSSITGVVTDVGNGETAANVAARFVEGRPGESGAVRAPKPGITLLRGLGLVGIAILDGRS